MSVNAFHVTTDTTGSCWNGPICQTCGARYLGSHRCSRADLIRRYLELLDALAGVDTSPQPNPFDRTRSCPCRPENGGSGVCGCVLGGPEVTC